MKSHVAIRLRNDARLRARRSGFVLMVVLAFIVIAALSTAGLARRSLTLALESVKAADDLQHRWARISFQRTLLFRADRILAAEATRRRADESQPTHFVDFTIRLGGEDYSLRLADEEAKANLNTVFHTQGENAVLRTVRELAAESAHLSVKLLPFDRSKSADLLPVFDSWGQVFDLTSSQQPSKSAESLMKATTLLTCWGGGQLNVSRSPLSVLEAVLRPIDQHRQLDRLIEARTSRATHQMAELLQSAPRTARENEILQWASLRSRCFSLWIRTHSRNSMRDEFHVGEFGERLGRIDVMSFVW